MWSPLLPEELSELFASRKYDIDYVCVKTNMKTLLEHQDMNRIVASCMGIIYRQGHTVRLRDGAKTEVFCIGDVAEFKLGIVLDRQETEDEQACFGPVEEVSEQVLSGQKHGLNRLLATTLRDK